MLIAENLQIGYNTGQPVFSNISFAAGGGEMIALLGVNGIGKSTLLRTVAGLQKAIGGKIEIDGKAVATLSAIDRATLISVVLTERVYIDNITVRNFIALGRSPYTGWLGQLSAEDEKVLDEVIQVVKIEKLADRLFNQLSDGEKQKATIARALCQQTPVMILDEPTAFLDFRVKKEIMDLLAGVCREMKKTIILSTHDIETSFTYCNKFWLMTEARQFIENAAGEESREEVMRQLFAEF